MPEPEPPEELPKTDIPQNVTKVSPDELILILQNKLTLLEANTEKERQRILDKIYEIVLQFAKLAESQKKEINLLHPEIERLQKLCKQHHIDPAPPKKAKPKNRKERRQAERDAKKIVKKKKK